MANLQNSAKEGVDSTDVLSFPTGYEPKAHDFYETTVEPHVQLLNPPPLLSNKASTADPDYDDATLEDLLHQAHRAQVDHSVREDLPVSLSSSSMSDRTGRPVGGRPGRLGEHQSSEAQIRTLLDDQREQILAEYQARIDQHEFQAARAEEEQRLLQGRLRQQKLEFREAHQRSLTEMEEIRKFQCSTFDTMARRKFVEDQNTKLKLSGRVQELQNEVNCMNDSKDFLDAESKRSGNSHVTSRRVSFPPHPIPEGMLRHSFMVPSRSEGPPSIWDTHGISGNVFANPDAPSSAPYPQELHQWNSSLEEPLHSSRVEKSERQTPVQDLRCQSGPSTKSSVIPSDRDYLKIDGADQQRLQIADLHFDKFPTLATFACWKIRFKTEVCSCSQFPTEAMQWIKEVELVDSVDDLESSSSIGGISMPNFEELDARIASALNKIIHNSHFKRRISLEEQKAQKQDRFLRGRQIAYLIYEYFRVTGANDSVENYADLFTIVLRSDDIKEFDSKCDEILLQMTQIPLDDILEGLYKLRLRESEKFKTVLELYDLEIHQKKLGLDYHRLKTMVKRSIEQDIQNKNFGARNGNYEKNAVVKNQGKQRVKRILGDCWQWEPNGQCIKGDNCSFRHDVDKRGKITQSNTSPNSFMQQNERKNIENPKSQREKVPVAECLDGLARITSKELAIIHFVKGGTIQNACSTRPRVVVGLGKSAHTHTVRLMNSRLQGQKRMMTKVQ